MMKCGRLMWFVWFIASFAAFHMGMIAFGYNLLAMWPISAVPRLPFIVSLIMGVCGLISLVMLMMECKECR